MLKEYIHYDRQMETAIIGALMLEKTAFARIRGLLTSECFYLDDNKFLFEVISEMWEANRPIDILTVTQYIVRDKKRFELLSGSVPYYVTKTTNIVVSTANLEAHSLLVRQLYAERELIKIKTSENEENGDVIERSEKIRDQLLKITQIKVSNDWADMSDVLIEMFNHMERVKDKELIGVPSGFKKLDLITSGFCNGELIIVAARPSVGKSALANSLILHAAKNNFKVGVISLEMPKVQIGARISAIATDTEYYKIYRNKLDDENERKDFYKKIDSILNLPIKISTKTNVNVYDIKAKAAQLIHKEQLDILFIDYLQLIESEGPTKNFNREQEVSKMSRGLKLMAMEYDIPVIVLAQLNRESEKLATKKPQLHHLRESGAIEQDADGVVFLHRDFKAGIITDENGNSTEREADLIIAKCRNGETTEIKIGFDAPKMKFYDLDEHNFSTKAPLYAIENTWKPYKDDGF